MTGKHKGKRLTRRERDRRDRARNQQVISDMWTALRDYEARVEAERARQADATNYAHRFFANACGGGR